MAKRTAGPRFFKRRGQDMTVKDSEGVSTMRLCSRSTARDSGHRGFRPRVLQELRLDGPARRAREKARKDAIAHQDDCPSNGNIRIGLTDKDPR